MASALKDWCGKSAREKRIPDFIITSPDNIRKAFLKGLFDGDGYKKGNQMHLHTSSKVLALQTQLIIASLGGMMGLTHAGSHEGKIRRKPVHTGESWQLRGKTDDIANIFGFEHSGKSIRRYIVTDDYIFVPVQGVEKENYDGGVHNIETGDNTYLVSNAVVHNCHEHLEYYTLYSIENLLARHDLEVFDVETNDVNGGSFRLYIRHKGARVKAFPGAEARIKKMRDYEEKSGYDKIEVYKQFAERTQKLRDDIHNFIEKEVSQGKKIYAYGASTKGNTLLQYCNLDSKLITAAAERNPIKWGKYTVGTNIPIISEDQARKDRPDFFFVLPWAFIKEFREREKEFYKNGGKFIVPLPDIKIIE